MFDDDVELDPNDPFVKFAMANQHVLKKKKTKVKNSQPEELIVKEILLKSKLHGFSLDRYESKAKRIVTNSGKPMWLKGGLKFGTPDIIGVKNGYAVYIEVKAKGCRNASNLRDDQRAFLTEKIKHGAFGVVVDSFDLLIDTYNKWVVLDYDNRIKLLLSDLP